MPSTLRYQVRQAPHGYWVEDTHTGKRVTPAYRDKRDDDKRLVRPCAKQRVRKIARRMNHRERNGLV